MIVAEDHKAAAVSVLMAWFDEAGEVSPEAGELLAKLTQGEAATSLAGWPTAAGRLPLGELPSWRERDAETSSGFVWRVNAEVSSLGSWPPSHRAAS